MYQIIFFMNALFTLGKVCVILVTGLCNVIITVLDKSTGCQVGPLVANSSAKDLHDLGQVFSSTSFSFLSCKMGIVIARILRYCTSVYYQVLSIVTIAQSKFL